MSIELFPFRHRNPLTGKWVRARYRATQQEIAARYTQWEITGAAEVRHGGGAMFNPRCDLTIRAESRNLADAPLEIDPHLAVPPAVDGGECALALLFLRRYVTFCARRRRYAQMEGAARLHAAVSDVAGRLARV